MFMYAAHLYATRCTPVHAPAIIHMHTHSCFLIFLGEVPLSFWSARFRFLDLTISNFCFVATPAPPPRTRHPPPRHTCATQPLPMGPTDAVFHSNRAACHLALGQPHRALADATEAARLQPSWPKAHHRLGTPQGAAAALQGLLWWEAGGWWLSFFSTGRCSVERALVYTGATPHMRKK